MDIAQTHTNIFPWELKMTMPLLCNGRRTVVSGGTLRANFVLLPSVRGAAYWIGGAVWSPDCPRCAGNELSEGWEGWCGPFQKYASPLRPLFLVVYNVKCHSCQDVPCLGDFSPLRQLFRIWTSDKQTELTNVMRCHCQPQSTERSARLNLDPEILEDGEFGWGGDGVDGVDGIDRVNRVDVIDRSDGVDGLTGLTGLT